MTEYQRCIVHMVRNTLKYVADKDRKEFANDLKTICHAPDEEQGYRNMQAVAEKWDKKVVCDVRRQAQLNLRLCSEFSVNAYPHGKTVHILRSSEPEAEAEPPPMAARSVLDRLA